MDPATAAEALRQVLEGEDFPAAPSLLRNITPARAAALPQGFKYSILTLAEHSRFWQEIWLARLAGRPKPEMLKDWRIPEPEEWPAVRQAFLDGLREALAIGSAEPFRHCAKSDESAVRALLKIAVHDAYHVGQIVILKRAVRG